MSHYAVFVVTDEEPIQTTLTLALQPFHEFECTGIDDQYVQDIDVTEERRGEFESGTRTLLRFPDGTTASPYDDRFYRDPTEEEKAQIGPMGGSGSAAGFSYSSRDWGDGLGYRPKLKFTPEGAEEVEVPYRELMTFAEYLKDDGLSEKSTGSERDAKYGYFVLDASGAVERVVRRTNPNDKWDWWQIGGRYSGKFAPGYDPETDPNHQETCWLCNGTGKRTDAVCENGCNGCSGTGVKTKWPTQWKGTPGNQIRVGDIPWDTLRQVQIDRHLAEYDKAVTATQGMELPQSWDAMREELGVEAAREKYNAFDSVKALRKLGIWDADETIEDLKLSREQIIARASRRPVTCWAVVKDGVWTEKGSMGWFGMSSGDKDPELWADEVVKLIEGLPADSWITCVDCHI